MILLIIALKHLVRIVKLVFEILFLSYLLISWWVTCNMIWKTLYWVGVCAQKGSWKDVSPHKNWRKSQRASQGMIVWIGCRVCYSRYNLTASSVLLESHDHDLSLIHKWNIAVSRDCGTCESAHPPFLPLLSKISSFRQHQMTYIILWWGILVTFFCCLSLSIVPFSWLYATSSQAALDVK